MPKVAINLSAIHPAMLTAIDQITVTYMAMRAKINEPAMRAKLETDQSAKASYDRKLVRVAMSLAMGASMSLATKQNPDALAEPDAPAGTAEATSAIAAILASSKGAGN
jgi:hypothetical protein